MTSAVYYDSPNELALLSVSFADASGNPADPTTVSCVITEPAGDQGHPHLRRHRAR